MATITNKRIFYINSRNRLSGTDSNFIYEIPMPPNSDYDRVCVLQCSIPKSYYLVETGYNTFQLKEGLTTVDVTIPVGNYTRKSLQIALALALNTSSPNGWIYNVIYPNTITQADTGKYIYTVSGNTSQPQLIFTTNLYEPCGFNENSTNTFVANTLSSTNVIKLQAEDTLYIHSDMVSNGNDNILQEVFANGDPSYSSVNFLTPSVEGYSKYLTSRESSAYNFYITDENNLPIDLNGQNCQIVILVYKEQNVYSMIKDFIKYELQKE